MTTNGRPQNFLLTAVGGQWSNNRMTPIKHLILDMDGVLWHGDTPVPGLAEFFTTLCELGIKFVLATNNATQTAVQYVEKLARFGVEVTPGQILTSAEATAAFLRERYEGGTAVYVIGDVGLRQALTGQGFQLLTADQVQAGETAPLVVAGLMRTATYHDLAMAALLIHKGAAFIGTNSDRTLPTELGPLPGAGAILALLTAATGVDPLVIGKPGRVLFEEAVKRLGGDTTGTFMVGDRLETDILGGKNAGLGTIFVLSGISTRADIATTGIQPDLIFADITDLANHLRQITQVITDSQQVNLEWLKAVFRQHGRTADALYHFEVDVSRSTNGHMAHIRLYEEKEAQKTTTPLLLKMYSGDTFANPSEVNYYTRDYCHLPRAPIPACYHAAYSNNPPAYHLLLEDLSATHQNGWAVTPTLAYGRAVAEALAALHAHRWGVEKLAAVGATIPGAKEINRYIEEIQPGLEPLLTDVGDDIDNSWKQALWAIFRHHPAKMIERARQPMGFTLIHGDPNPGNILFPKNGAGPVYLIDRQPFDWSLTTWLGVSDVAYMMVHWWDTELRREWEFPILRAYHEALQRAGVTGYTWEQLVEDYKLTAVQSIYVAVSWCADEEERQTMKWVWFPQLQKAMTAFFDLQCDRLWLQSEESF